MSDFDAMELQELNDTLAELDAEFEELGGDFGEEAFEELSELDVELAGTGLDFDGEDLGDLAALSTITDDPIEAQFFGNWIKRKVKKLIRKIVKLVKKYKKCATCVPKVTKAVALFKAKKYAKALWEAKNAYSCIRRCLKK